MKTKQHFVCRDCGASSPVWQGQCPRCRQWNTLAAQTVTAAQAKAKSVAGLGRTPARPVALSEIVRERQECVSTGTPDLDRFLGRGLAPGGAVLLGGEPGIGKSTLLLQLAGQLARDGRTAVYLSGEESLGQVRDRAERLGLAGVGQGLLALASNRAEDAVDLLESADPPHLIIIDSVQTLGSASADGMPGSVSQVRAVSCELIEAVKRTASTLILVGHVTKDGQIAGPKLMEHMVDTVLSLEGERHEAFRLLRVLKNRFGPSDELLVFRMGGQGMELVSDPSTTFLGARDPSLSGTALVMALDGQRPFAVEVQALASRSFLAVPRRTALGFDVNRLHLLLAVLEKRLKVSFGQVDIHAKIGGGLRTQEPGLDVGLVAAVLSSFYDQALPEGAVFWGEVDLNGQIRPVAGQDVRLRQAERLGLGPIFCPREGAKGCSTLADLSRGLFGAG